METKIKSLIKPNETAWQTYTKQSSNNQDMPQLKKQPEAWTKTYYKAYARMPTVALPPPDALREITLKDALVARKSGRNPKRKSKLTQSTLSTILQYAMGLNPPYDDTSTGDASRFYPSAGGRYPIEAYLLLQNNDIVVSSIYHYYVRYNSLEKLFPLNKDSLKKAFLDDFIRMYPCLLVLTGFMPRTTIKYKNRGFNYALIEAGHIGQNVYLLSAALGIQCCSIGGFIEKEICNMLDINPQEEYPLYVLGLR